MTATLCDWSTTYLTIPIDCSGESFTRKEKNAKSLLQTCTLHPFGLSPSLVVEGSLSGKGTSPSGRVRHRFSRSLVLSLVLSQACFQFEKYFLDTFGLLQRVESCLEWGHIERLLKWLKFLYLKTLITETMLCVCSSVFLLPGCILYTVIARVVS